MMTPALEPMAAELDLRVASVPPCAPFEPALVAPTPAWARSAWARAAIALVSLLRSLCTLVAGGAAAAELLAARDAARRGAVTDATDRAGEEDCGGGALVAWHPRRAELAVVLADRATVRLAAVAPAAVTYRYWYTPQPASALRPSRDMRGEQRLF